MSFSRIVFEVRLTLKCKTVGRVIVAAIYVKNFSVNNSTVFLVSYDSCKYLLPSSITGT